MGYGIQNHQKPCTVKIGGFRAIWPYYILGKNKLHFRRFFTCHQIRLGVGLYKETTKQGKTNHDNPRNQTS